LLIFCLSLIYIFLYSMILYMLRRDRKRRIPYIPFLFLAYLTTWMI
jgi:prepilin signal peptidase PulO-like enzyme (type II secretory pathway)